MLSAPKYKNNLATGVFYFGEGFNLIKRPELRRYILVPLVVNCVLFFVLTSAFIHYYGGVVESTMEWFPDWLGPLKDALAWFAWVVVGILLLIIYGYSFNIITNIIAAPFYGMLSAKTEELVTGQAPPDISMGTMILHTVSREFSKLKYFLVRGIAVALVMVLVVTIPIVNFTAPLIGLAWAAWSMAIQYSDYAADNNQLKFTSLRHCLWNKKYSSLGFGGLIMLCSITPIINIIAMPVAVTGGTLFWLRELKGCQQGQCPTSYKPYK